MDRYSLRTDPPSSVLVKTISRQARHRIVNAIRCLPEAQAKNIFIRVGHRALVQHGLERPSDHQMEWFSEYIQQAFFNYTDDRLLDLMEWVVEDADPKLGPTFVRVYNVVFREEGIGYRFSDYITQTAKGISPSHVDCTADHVIYRTTIQPALTLLSKAEFVASNTEMLEAHKHFRAGEWSAAITSAGKSFESVLKTICEKKRWTYDRNKAGLSDLLAVCQTEQLFPSYYKPVLESVGTVRNKQGAHGRGPNPPHDPADERTAEHMLQMTSAHILFVVRQAGL